MNPDILKLQQTIQIIDQFRQPQNHSFKKQQKQIFLDEQYTQIKIMNQITIITILQKIRSICKEGKLDTIPQRIASDSESLSLQIYLKTLQRIRLQFIKYRNLQQQYLKLQNMLQKQEMQIRKRVSIEQQLKLYTDTLKTQVEELQKQKLQLLENSKAYIKELKKNNQSLFSQLHSHTQKKGKNKSKSKEQSPQKTQKTKINKSLSHYKSKHDKSIKEIIKTEYIQRDRSNSGNKKKYGKNHKFGVYSTLSAHAFQPTQNAKTFQVIGNTSGKKDKTGSRKRNKHIFSNLNLLNFMDVSNKKLKKGEKSKPLVSKSPGKMQKSKEQSRIQNNTKVLWKQKKANKSIISVSSMEPNVNSKKQTI